MSERKVLSKYYPSDFDPRQVPRTKRVKGSASLQPVRVMAPFSMRCTTCGGYMAKGTTFNARKGIADETYLGIVIFRFFIRCRRCAAEITFKTDPKASDYACERGALRNSVAWRPSDTAEETVEERLDRLEEEDQEQRGDDRLRTTMDQLEKRTIDAETDLAVADALDEIRLRSAQRDRAGRSDSGITATSSSADAALQEEQDTEKARRAFANHRKEQVQESQPSPDHSRNQPPRVDFQPHKRSAKPRRTIFRSKRKGSSQASPSLVNYYSDSE